MPYRVSRETLLLLAGLFWALAGVNVLRLGIRYWMDNPGYFLFKLSEMLVIFFVFLGFIFQNLYRKHTLRIIHKPEKNPVFSFFDGKSWLVVGVMISLGVCVRLFQLLPGSFIAVFYTGLALALIVTGCRFLFRWWCCRKRME